MKSQFSKRCELFSQKLKRVDRGSFKTVFIPFKPQFKDVLLNGQKVMTSRTRTFGKCRDQFRIFGGTFEILSVKTMMLNTIATKFFNEEGCDSPEDFMRVWCEIHPYKGFQPFQFVHVHIFRRIR